MTISTAYSFSPTRDELIRTAFRLVGELPMGAEPSADQVLGASDLLNAILKALKNAGTLLHTIEGKTQATTSGTASYPADADTVDVLFPGYVTSTTGTGGTSQLLQMQRDRYMEISDKTVTGTPLWGYVDRTSVSVLSLVLYPVPDATVASFTYNRVRLLRDSDSGTVTQDLPSNWVVYLQYRLAHDLALHLNRPASKVSYLMGLAERERREAEGANNPGGDIQFVLSSSRGRW